MWSQVSKETIKIVVHGVHSYLHMRVVKRNLVWSYRECALEKWRVEKFGMLENGGRC